MVVGADASWLFAASLPVVLQNQLWLQSDLQVAAVCSWPRCLPVEAGTAPCGSANSIAHVVEAPLAPAASVQAETDMHPLGSPSPLPSPNRVCQQGLSKSQQTLKNLKNKTHIV